MPRGNVPELRMDDPQADRSPLSCGSLAGFIERAVIGKQFDDQTKAQVQLLLANNFAKAQRYDLARNEYTTVKNRYPKTPQAIEAEFGIGA